MSEEAKPNGLDQMPEKSADLGNRLTENNDIAVNSEIPPPTPEQIADLWVSTWNAQHSPQLAKFFSGAEEFPVNPGNYAKYAEIFNKHFEAMKQILEGKKLSDLYWEPTQPPYSHEIQYKGSVPMSEDTRAGQEPVSDSPEDKGPTATGDAYTAAVPRFGEDNRNK